MAGRAVGDLLQPSLGQRGKRVAPVSRVGLASDPLALLETDHHLRESGLAAVALRSQVTELHHQVVGHGQAREDAVLEVRCLGVLLQLTIEQRGQCDDDGKQVLPDRLLVFVKSSGRPLLILGPDDTHEEIP
ncbi:hypothetical protein [Rhodococcus sp. IEGM 1379]|uniref:hypothetical protein n=1 Tax=Rhodococcus sp. IEGM 1379 TaxID=3047086 RepID=UPI0024B8618B|nr:hypothetical protein [Rhodococcus sp. IEGM 1379]MDI9913659.1 hypothetical protein [Rhodococcus sp. IEGM 1379]